MAEDGPLIKSQTIVISGVLSIIQLEGIDIAQVKKISVRKLGERQNYENTFEK